MLKWSGSILQQDRDFRWYWVSQSSSLGGAQVTAFTLPLVVTISLGGGAAGVSAVTTAAFLPNLILPLLAGHLLEGWRKRQVMMWADALRAVLIAVVPIAWVGGFLSLPLLVAVAFLVGSISVFFDISGFALIPTLVPDRQLNQANQAVQGSATVAQVSGPGAAGLLVQGLGAPLALVVDVLAYLVSLLGLSKVRRVDERLEERDRTSRVRDGVLLLMRNAYLRALTVHAGIYNAAAMILTVNLVVWAVQERSLSAGAFGLALSCAGAGALIGTMVILKVVERLGFGRSFVAALVLSTATPLMIALIPGQGTSVAVALGAIQFVSGIGLGGANVLSRTLRQVVVPRGQVARTNGGYRFLMYGTIPLGSLAGGVVGTTFGPQVGVAVGTIGLAISALPMITRQVRRLREPQDAIQHTTPTPAP